MSYRYLNQTPLAASKTEVQNHKQAILFSLTFLADEIR
jgi:hypothetical protein